MSLSFRKKLKASLIYPAFLIVMVIGLFIFLITFVVPRFAQLYDQLNGTKLPSLTRFPLLDLGKAAQEAMGIYFAVVLGLGIWLFLRWTKTEAGATAVDKVRVSTADFRVGVAESTRSGCFRGRLSTLLTGGLPLVPSLETAAKSIESRQIAKAVFRLWRACARARAWRGRWT